MLRIDDISYSIAGRPLFEQASATIPDGHKVGLVGPNGAGKTTLFKLIRGELGLDGGTIDLPPRARIGGVAQEAPGTALSVLDTVLAADEERAALLNLAREANTPGWWHAYSDVLPNWLEPYVGLEAAASIIRTYQIQFVPGLLQTEGYARALIRQGSAESEEEIARRSELRASRQVNIMCTSLHLSADADVDPAHSCSDTQRPVAITVIDRPA